MSTKNRITLIVNANQNPSYIPNVPQHTNIRQCTSPGACPDIYTGEGGPGTGARLCYEYNNGTETTTPLWPWRMDQRIKDALALAGSNELAGGAHIGGLYAAKTVTSEIASRYGVPPPDCMRTGDGPPPGPTGPRTLFVDPTGTGTCAQAEQTATQTPIPMNNLVTMLTSCARGGDTVVLKFGTYAACLNDIIPSGSTSGDTVLRAETVGQAVIKPLASPTCPNTSAIYINNKQYISLSGLTIDLSNTPSGAINDGGVWLDGTTNHVTITGVEVKGMGVPGAFGGCAFCLYPQTSQNTVRNSLIHDLATSITNASVRATCFDNYGSQNTVENNICHHVAHTGYYGFTTGPASSNNIVRGNQFHNLGARGIYVSSGANNVVVNNLITQVGLGNGQEALIIGGGGGVAPTNTEILHNTITNNPGTGINVASGSGAILLNNILWQNTGGTIVNSGTGTVDDSNLKAIDPCFVNASLADFHLTTLSPAWNQGKATGSPNSVTVVADDITGLARQGTKPDIGCYELDETTVPTAAGQPTMRLLKRHIPGLMGLR
jgi:parallel beta-helix repeat protein